MITICYLILIAVLILFSWVGSIYGLLLPDGSILPNLLSERSVRWFVRNSLDTMAEAPFVEIMLVLMLVSALRCSGLLPAIVRRTPINRRHRYALRTSLVVFAVCICLLLIGIAPGGNLLSVTGHIVGGPFADGWLFLVTLAICLPCVIYGRMSGLWRTVNDVLAGLSSEIVRCADCLVTCVVASQLMAAIQYVCLFEYLGLGAAMTTLTEICVYGLPFVWRWYSSFTGRRIS